MIKVNHHVAVNTSVHKSADGHDTFAAGVFLPLLHIAHVAPALSFHPHLLAVCHRGSAQVRAGKRVVAHD